MVKAENFHPMRGDVSEGNSILFSSGRILTIRDSGCGWKLVSNEGLFIAGPFPGANELTSWIAQDLY